MAMKSAYPKNQIRKLRLQAGLSLRELSRATGISARILLLIEGGHRPAAWSEALRLSEQLSPAAVEALFPAAKKWLKPEVLSAAMADPDTQEKVRRAGINLDSRQWIMIVRLTNGTELRFAPDSGDVDKLNVALNEGHEESPFFALQMEDGDTLILNVEKVESCQVLYEQRGSVEPPPSLCSDVSSLLIWMTSSGEPTKVAMEADFPEGSDDDEQERPVWNLEYDLLTAPDRFVAINDRDGEDLYLAAREIMAIAMPAYLTEVTLDDLEGEDDLWEESATAPLVH